MDDGRKVMAIAHLALIRKKVNSKDLTLEMAI
jgi:hypothetical protein